MACPNINSPQWRDLVSKIGTYEAMREFIKNGEEIPNADNYQETFKGVNATLKIVAALQKTPRQVYPSNSIQGFYNDLIKQGAPKHQIDLLKEHIVNNNITDINTNDLITSLLAEMSYTIEINTAKENPLKKNEVFGLPEIRTITSSLMAKELNGKVGDYFIEVGDEEDSVKVFKDLESANIFARTLDKTVNTQHYSNMTVPGGTNYTENEIATPAIVPSIKGHAQFSTENGIGWFRSDVAVTNVRKTAEGKPIIQTTGFRQEKHIGGEETKTRRILEVQSDLFQRGRSHANLVMSGTSANEIETKVGELNGVGIYQVDSKDNQFLQLLAKDNNWQTFFVKSIIQDSAKKGYEKVLFPSGDTAAKVEGHETIETFIKRKEDRLKELENNIKKIEYDLTQKIDKSVIESLRQIGDKRTEDQINNESNIDRVKGIEKSKNEILQIEKEIEDAKTGKLKISAIAKFYEETIANILKKQGYSPSRIKDEYGNEWNEVALSPEIAKQTILLQKQGTESSKASEKTVAKVKEFLSRIGVDIKTAKIDSNGAALLLEDLIKIAEGKEDVALTEEAMHFAVEIIEQTNPSLYKQMLNKIGTYNVYKDIFPIYAKDKEYQIGGSPNVLKIKKEAIGKVLAEYVIKGEEGTTEKPELLAQTLTWWDQIKNFFLSLIGKAGFNPFEEASNLENIKGTTKDLEAPFQPLADRILEKNIPGIYGMVIGKAIKEGRNRAAISVLTQQLEDPSTYPTVVKDYLMGDEQLAKDLLASQETYKQIAPTEEATYDRIINTAKDIEKKESPTKKDENGKPIDSYFYKGKEILKRVTDKAKFYYERLFGNKSISDTEYHKAVKTIMADEGTNGHEDIQHAGHILIKNGEFNPDATLDSSYIPKTNRAIYKVLFDNLKERLSTYPGAKFIQEVAVVDEQKDVAGTIDLLIVKPDGSVQIVDWKFINLNTEKFTDVPWFKQRAWNIQIAEYKRILADRYGIPSHMIKGEAIPIKANYDYPGTVDGSKSLPILKSVEIGNVDVKTEDRDYLLPVTLSGQDTGNKEINKLLSKLNALHTNLENTDVRGTEEKAKKAEQLQFIDKAMRHLAVRNTIGPLINQASVYTKDVQRVIDIFNNSYKDRDFTTSPPSNQELSDYGVQLDNALSQISIYTNLDITLKSLAGTDVSADAHKAHRELVAIVDDARFLEDALKNTINELGEKIANSLGFKNLTNPEPVVTAISRNFNETSKLPTQVLQVMFQKIREANNLSSVTTNEENTELEEIKKDYEKLAASKGLNMKNMFSLVMNYSKNKLIDQFKGEFYTEARAAIKDKREGIKWIVENIDVEKYKKELSEDLEKKIELINSRPWTEEEKKKEIERKRIEYDTSKPDSLGWYLHYYILRNSPIEEKWTSPEWKTLWEKGNEPAQRLYKWVRDINQKAEDVGYLPDDKATRTFLPFVVKSFAEKVIFGGSLTVGEEFIRSMTVDSDTVGYGSIDPLTGKPVLRIPKYFTNKTDKDLSTNLFKNLAIYNQALNKYKYISEVEGIAKVLGRLERNKGSIITNQYGKALFDKETGSHELSEDNSRNTKLFEDQMATLIYGQKYINSEKFDTLLSKVGGTFEKINKTLGVKIMPEGLSERQFSLNKSIDTLNRFFQQKTLGLNPLPALSNLVGGTLQLTINSGKFMNKKELLASQANLASAAVRGEEGKKLLAAMEYFMPFTGNENFRASLHKLSLTRWTENNIQDFLMVLMRSGDKYVQATIFSTLWENAILVDGKIYNAREYVRKETSYKDRYKSNNLEEEEGKFNELVKEVKEKYSLSKQAVIDEKGKLKLPIDRDSSEAFKITNLSQALSKRATGNLTAADVRGINQNIWSNSFMVFKNWIPSLWDARFGKQKYASDVEAYEWGRARTVGRVMLMDGVKSISSLVDLLTFNAFSVSTAGKMVKGTEAGLKSLQELYEYKRQQYFISTGRELNITQDEFFDLVRQNIRNQAKDTLITLSLLAMFFAVKALPPDPDEDPNVINQHKFLVRALDKLSDEVSFYYLPTSFQSMLNGSVMPSVAVLSDGIRVITHGFTELYGDAFDEKIAEKNYFVKYLAKSFPITAQMSSYMPLYAPDLAKELGIQLGTQARR